MSPTPSKRPRAIGPALALSAAVLAIAAALLAVRAGSRPDPERLLAKARADHDAGRDRAARAALTRLGRLRAPTTADRILRAQVASALGEDPTAELAAIPQGDPLAPLARLLAGRSEVARGRLRLAEAHFLDAIARDPDAAQPRRELAYLYALQHRIGEMDGQFAALSRRDQLDDASLLIWARIHCASWNPARDEDALRGAIAADPDDRMSRMALAEGLLISGRVDEAARLLAPLPAADPDAAAHRFALAMARGDPDTAESILADADTDARGHGLAAHPRLLRLRGQLDLARQDLPAAVEHLQAAVALDPADRASLFNLGTALKQLGRPDEAAPHLEAARRQDAVLELMRKAVVATGTVDPTLPTRLGLGCLDARRPDEARAWLKLAVRRNPLDLEAQKALHRLDHPAG